ncbi:hypothetical protein V3391_03820 [Luteimonas sp. SMYT11W]|uniref:Uncharacterized protein n=1 Tax=Luteimonas flava TaxID=3115822 RepID=A0ABU7WCX4_9GAMM
MNAHAEQGHIATAPSTEGRGAIGKFFDTLIGTIFIVLLAAGLIALTSTWQSSDLLFEGTDRVLVTQTSWWGLQSKVTVLEASQIDGWTILKENGDRVPMRSQSMRLPR